MDIKTLTKMVARGDVDLVRGRGLPELLKELDWNTDEASNLLLVALLHRHNGLLDNLILKGGLVNREFASGDTLLHLAILSGNSDLAEHLVSFHRANMNAIDANEHTPLYIAIEKHDVEMVRFLLTRWNIKLTESVLEVAVESTYARLLLPRRHEIDEKKEFEIVDLMTAYLDRFPSDNLSRIAAKLNHYTTRGHSWSPRFVELADAISRKQTMHEVSRVDSPKIL